MRNNFPNRSSSALLHILSKLYDVPLGFYTPPLWCSVLLYLRSPKGGWCSISNDLTCSLIWLVVSGIKFYLITQLFLDKDLWWRYNIRNVHIVHFVIQLICKWRIHLYRRLSLYYTLLKKSCTTCIIFKFFLKFCDLQGKSIVCIDKTL